MSTQFKFSAVVLTKETSGSLLKQLDQSFMAEPRSDKAVGALEELIKHNSEVCIAARFIGEGKDAYDKAYAKVNGYVTFLQSKTDAVCNIPDSDFFYRKVNDSFAETNEGEKVRSFIVRLNHSAGKVMDGFDL